MAISGPEKEGFDEARLYICRLKTHAWLPPLHGNAATGNRRLLHMVCIALQHPLLLVSDTLDLL